MPRGSLAPGFTPPSWPRLGARRNDSQPVGGLPLPPADIPVTWLSQPLALRLERPVTHAEVTQLDGSTARTDAETLGLYGSFPFAATLSTAVDADPANLAHWTVTYNAAPRMSSPNLVINLLYRTDAEKVYLLQIGRGRRIRITGLPNEWPSGANTLVVRGIRHDVSEFGRALTWVTEPVLGLSGIVSDNFFRNVSSSWGAATSGQVYTLLGTASDFSVTPSTGIIDPSTGGSLRAATAETLVTDWDETVRLSIDNIPGSGITQGGLVGRSAGSNTFYYATMRVDTSGAVNMRIARVVSGSTAAIGTVDSYGATYVAGQQWFLRFQGIGPNLKFKLWPATSTQPSAWSQERTDTNITTGTQVGCVGVTDDLARVLSYSNFSMSMSTGTNPQGVAGPWFRWGTSSWGGTDTRPF